MKNLTLVTDSTCDISVDMIEKLGIKVARIPYFVDQVEYSEETNKNMPFSEFYNRMRNGSDIKTSMINEYQATEVLEEILKAGKNALYIGLSGGLSGTFESFKKAAEKLNTKYKTKAYVTDSQSGSGGIAIQIEMIYNKAQSVDTMEELLEYANSLSRRVSSIFTVDDLKHLLTGGRISKAMAIIGSILSIKPIVYSNHEGKLASLCKVISRKKSLIKLHEIFKSKFNNEFNKVYVTHADSENDAQFLANLIKKDYPEVDVVVELIDVVLGSHCGPACIALFFTTDEK